MADNIPVEGNLDLKGNQIKNAGFEVVTSLPTTNNFIGRQVTYQGRSYIWDGSVWKCDSDYLEIGGRNVIKDSNNINLFSKPHLIIVSENNTDPFSGNEATLITLHKINYDGFRRIDNLVEGQIYSVNLWVKLDTATNFVLNVSDGNTYFNLSRRVITEQGWQKLQTTFVANSYKRVYIHFGGALDLLQENGNVYVYGLNLEIGNIATDWTPAPEDKANENQTINFDTSNIEPTQTGTTTKTSTWLWQYLTQSVNFLWLKVKDLFPTTQATTHNYLPKIDNANKKLVKSNIQDDGSRVQINSPLMVNSKTYYNVAQRISSTASETGTIKITLPFGWNNNMGIYEIDIYHYAVNAHAKVIISAYNWAGGIWDSRNSVRFIGTLPNRTVRLAYDGSKCCILIGITTTQWGYPQIYVSKVTQGFTNTADWSTGWSISIITDESNITNIVTPQVNAGFDVDLLDGKHLSEIVNGTTNYIPKFTGANSVGDSIIYATADKVGIGKTDPSEKLDVNGSIKANGYKVGSGTDTKLLTDGGGTKLISDFAALENGKIKASNLPDYLLGQVLYGGSINSSQVCTLSSLYKDKFNTTDTTRLLSNLTASSHVGVYFIASGNFLLNGTIDVNVGDWVISDGNSWGKIDNTDAVASVNGYTGVINLGYEDLGDMPVATDVKVGGIKIGFTAGNDGAIPIQLDGNYKAYIELLAKHIRYAIANDTIINGNKYWLKNKTIIIPDGSADSGYSEGLRIANSPHGFSTIALGTDNTASGLNIDGKQWNIIKAPTGELVITYDSNFNTGLTLYKNGDIYWKGVKLNLPRATSVVNGWLHTDDFTRFSRVADHAQITLASGQLIFDESQTYIGGHEIFVNGNDSPDFDDSGLYDGYGSYNLVAGRRYEVIINMGMSILVGGGLITLQLKETGGAVIKSTPTTANVGYLSMSLSCIVDGGNPISVSIQKDSGIELNLEQNQCWFAVHEIR